MSLENIGQDEAIGQFCGVTGANEERAKSLLEACDWNLELAINMHVDTDDGRRQGAANSSNANRPIQTRSDSPSNILRPLNQSSSSNRARNNDSSRHPSDIITINDDEVRPPIPPVRQVLVDSPMPTSSHGPSGSRFNTRSNRSVYDGFRDFQAEAHWLEMNRDGEPSATSDTSSTAATKRRTLEELFRPPLDLMFRGSLISAREVGQHQNRWLLINVQNVQEFACQILNRDVWSNQAVKDIIKEHFVFWQVYHDSGEGSKYIQFYNVKTFPHVAIVDPRTGEQLKSWSKTIDHNTFCDSVIEFLTEHPSPDGTGDASSMKKLRLKEDETAATLYDQSEEAQLAAAIKASLQEVENCCKSFNHNADDDDCEIESLDSDTETSRSSLDTSGRSKLNQQQTNSSTNNGQHSKSSGSSGTADSFAEYSGLARSCRDPIEESECTISKKCPKIIEDYTKYLGKDSEKFSDLVVRFPDGSRNQLKLPADTQLKALFLLLASRGYDMENFNYVTNFPRRNLQELCTSDSLQDVKLIRETVYVERKAKE